MTTWNLDLIVDASKTEAGTKQDVTIMDVPQEYIGTVDALLDALDVAVPGLILRNWWQAADQKDA